MKRLIVIDAGHGAKDPGAIGYSKKNQEKAFNLSVALKVNELLKNDTNLEVRLTRSTDVFLELKERSDFANKAKADAFISIHANSASTTATGTETHYTRADSKALAEVIHKHVLKATGLKDRGLHTGNLYVTKHTNMPAILLEPGFVSNPTEEAILFDGNFQTKLAQEIVSGLKEYFRVDTKAPTPSNTPYPEMTVTVDNQSFIGYNINNFTWIPSRPVGEMLGGTIDYVKGKVTINGNAVDTKLINGVGFVTARDLTDQLGARIYWEKSEPYNVIIYPKL
ncbi:N-acetylmuramoyl-L-alanine amidase [Paenibacillus sp. XY044]|uniref:N-acetylmuramoyl-L-alanine amidase n=1 Tax=Paenibacillus sp. XY044 TaxID=2026089 RepID=UPI0015C63E30|nr:N-acetylmuramoyl-L-alanine amidase [Paenibacillus sp. XY044]